MVTSVFIAVAVVAALGAGAYLAACAGAQRWLILREWWGK